MYHDMKKNCLQAVVVGSNEMKKKRREKKVKNIFGFGKREGLMHFFKGGKKII
jgi:hypothetical protein